MCSILEDIVLARPGLLRHCSTAESSPVVWQKDGCRSSVQFWEARPKNGGMQDTVDLSALWKIVLNLLINIPF
jgi:hypothetical protein